MKKIVSIILFSIAILPATMSAQQVLTLDECRQMAIKSNNDLKTAQQQIEIAGYDRKIAAAYYYPKISATGAYQYTDKNIQLVSDQTKTELSNAGTVLQQDVTKEMMTVLSDPVIFSKVMSDPSLQKLLGYLGKVDVATPINAIGTQISRALTIDIENVVVGTVSVQQPVFAGGKIMASNKMAEYAEDLAKSQYDQQRSETIAGIDEAYWQIVSIAGKKRLADSYASLLHQMEKDTQALINEGFATPSDALTVKVKANEADMLLTKATNGLALAKMLLCKECGLPLDSDVVLADENLETIPVPEICREISDEEVYESRPEIKSLNLANKIYEKKIDIARADMLPTIALTANYIVTNPNLSNGLQYRYGGFCTAGVVVSIPLFHGTEALQKTRKAQAEAELTKIKLDDAKKMISLQVSQLRKQETEALSKLTMAQSNMENAEENLRVATAGWNEGVIASNVLLQAQTAWLQAHSEYIETGVELQMCSTNLAKAEGRL